MSSVASRAAQAAWVEASNLVIHTPQGRLLFDDLSLTLGCEQAALVGRNGVGKTTLLRVLADERGVSAGALLRRTRPMFVPQDLHGTIDEELLGAVERGGEDLRRELRAAGLRGRGDFHRSSDGERRIWLLAAAKVRSPDLLLLDEPTEGLAEGPRRWLIDWVSTWRNGLLVVSHDRDLLQVFRHFLVVAESGCRYVPGSYADLERELQQDHDRAQEKYLRSLNMLLEREDHHARVTARRGHKKQVGRVREEKRCPNSRLLNSKRSYAQESQGKRASVRNQRIAAVRQWSLGVRRAMTVELPLRLLVPQLPEPSERPAIALQQVSAGFGERALFSDLSLQISRERVAVRGPNGAGKTTLLDIMRGERMPASGEARRDASRVGAIAQGASNWLVSESLLELLLVGSSAANEHEVAGLLMAHRFPLALAERPLRSLSPGERARAALLCLYRRSPVPEVLVLDEPTYALDVVGAAALTEALRMWPGGLVVVSHDSMVLASIGVQVEIVLDGEGGHVIR